MTALTKNLSGPIVADDREGRIGKSGGNAVRFSIITVSYNEVQAIAQTLRSILDQTWPEIELIVIDGGSTDGTVDAIIPFRDRLTAFVTEPDHGLYDAMNKGLDRATGDFICFMNAGDVFAASTVLASVAAAIGDQRQCCFGRARIEGSDTNFYNPPLGSNPADWIRRGIPSHQATFYPAAFAREARYDTSLGSVADTDFTFRCFSSHGWRFLDLECAHFRLGGVSNAFSTWASSWHTAMKRRQIVKRNPGWFAPSFQLVYIAGPVIGFMIQRCFGGQALGKLRKFKGRS